MPSAHAIARHRTLTEQVERDPGSTAYGALAQWHRERGELSTARAVCEQGFGANPSWPAGALIYLEVLQQLGHVEEASEVFGRAIVHHPLSAELRLAWAAVLSHAGRPREAQRLAYEARDLGPVEGHYQQLATRLLALVPEDFPLSGLRPPEDLETATAPSTPTPEPATKRSKTAEIPTRLRNTEDHSPVLFPQPARPLWPWFVLTALVVAGLTAFVVSRLGGQQPSAPGPVESTAVVAPRPPAPKPAVVVPKPAVVAPALEKPKAVVVAKPKVVVATEPKVAVVAKPTEPTEPSAKRFPRGDPRRQLADARALTEAGKHRAAVELGHRALRRLQRRAFLRENELVALIALGRALSRGNAGALARSKDFLHEAARRPNAPVSAFLELGRTYRQLGDLSRAVWCFRRAAKDRLHAEAQLELGRTLWRRRAWRTQGRQALRRFLKLAPTHQAAEQVRQQLRR